MPASNERYVRYMTLMNTHFGCVCVHCRKQVRTGEKFRVLGRQVDHQCVHDECFNEYKEKRERE